MKELLNDPLLEWRQLYEIIAKVEGIIPLIRKSSLISSEAKDSDILLEQALFSLVDAKKSIESGGSGNGIEKACGRDSSRSGSKGNPPDLPSGTPPNLV